jgi:HAD superfamily hydrolase (TIGR01549 family)
MAVAVLFDLEETLVETPWISHVAEFRTATRKRLLTLGIPQNVLEGVERSTVMRNKAVEYVQGRFAEPEQETFVHEMERFLKAYELDAAHNSKLFPETVPTLEKLRAMNVSMGLVTNTSREAVDIDFRLHGIGGYFSSVVTRERVTKLKPDPEGIILAAKELGAKRFFMVGDLALDVHASKAANAICIIVKRSHGDALNLNPDYYVESLSEVPAIVGKHLETTQC